MKEEECQTPLSVLSESTISVLKAGKDLSQQLGQRIQTKVLELTGISQPIVTKRIMTKWLRKTRPVYKLEEYPLPLLDLPHSSLKIAGVTKLKIRKNQSLILGEIK